MIVNRFLVPLFAVGLFLGVVAVAMANGNWIVSGKEMVDVTHLTQGAEIKGWMTLQQVADGFGISSEDVRRLAGLPNDLPDSALKDLEGVAEGFDIALLRDAIDEYLAQGASATAAPSPQLVPPAAVIAAPTSSVAPTIVPQPATPPAPLETPNETPVSLPQRSGAGDGTGPTALPDGETLPGAAIKGKQTLAEIADQAQISLEDLLAALSLPADQDPATTVRQLVDAGLVSEVEMVRAAVSLLQGE